MNAAPEGSPGPALIASHARFRDWMFTRALPFWGSAGHDGVGGGAREHLTLEGLPGDAPFTRMRVQARQLYVFSHASLLGWSAGLPLAHEIYGFITRHGELATGGWARTLSPADGEVLDPAVDLYDQAFVLFALAYYGRASGGTEIRVSARRTIDWIAANMRMPPAGFANVLPHDHAPRQQNPHMHLLEAILALDETWPDSGVIGLAHELVGLFRRHLFDPATGTLGEYFEPDWSPCRGEPGRHVEPGHHYEWVWLLDAYARRASVDVDREIDALYRFARQYGTDDGDGLVFDIADRDGSVIKRSTRLWPQTESLKAHAVMARRGGDGAALVVQVVSNLFRRFLANCPDGAWIDQFDSSGRPQSSRIPTSSFYHLFMAYAELDRMARDRPGRPGA
jgi:mannose-6-phosphate isomerase